MDFVAAGLSSLITVFMLALFMAGVMKLFQIHTTLTEIKDALKATPVAPRASVAPVATYAAPSPAASPAPAPAPPLALHEMQSGEEMLRALDAQIHMEDRARNPEVIEPR
jgi:hypothetical protein